MIITVIVRFLITKTLIIISKHMYICIYNTNTPLFYRENFKGLNKLKRNKDIKRNCLSKIKVFAYV